MADVIDIPTKGIPDQVSPSEIWRAAKPNDRQVWAVCPYLRGLERCMGCPAWDDDPRFGRVKRGCRALAEEACRVVMAGNTETHRPKQPVDV